MILGDIPEPGLFSTRRPAHSRKRVRGMPLLKASVAVRSNVRRARDLAQNSDLHNVQLAGCPPPSPASEEKDCRVAPDTKPVHSVSFIVETGPEALAGSARIRRSKVTSFGTGSRVVLGSLEWVGTQATELLIAVHWSLRGPPRKKLRLCSYLESIQSACRFDSSFDSGQAGSGHRS